jgi:hypothetical protein
MAGPIVTRERIQAEFDRIKAHAYEFSEAEICILVAANLVVPVEAVLEVVGTQGATA